MSSRVDTDLELLSQAAQDTERVASDLQSMTSNLDGKLASVEGDFLGIAGAALSSFRVVLTSQTMIIAGELNKIARSIETSRQNYEGSDQMSAHAITASHGGPLDLANMLRAEHTPGGGGGGGNTYPEPPATSEEGNRDGERYMDVHYDLPNAGTPEETFEHAINNFDETFPFETDADGPIEVGQRIELRPSAFGISPDIGVLNNPVEVTAVGDNYFQLKSLEGHAEGADRNIRFTFSESFPPGTTRLEVDSWGPDSFGSGVTDFFGVSDSVFWQDYADNLSPGEAPRNQEYHLPGPNPPGEGDDGTVLV